MLEGLTEFRQVDERVRAAFKLEGVEWALVEDLCELTLPDYRGDATSPGYQPTLRKLNAAGSNARAGMAEYCDYFCEVLRAGFGEEKSVCATVYEEVANDYLPVRLVAIHLDWPGQALLRSEPVSNHELRTRIQDLAHTLRIPGRMGADDHQGYNARVYSFVEVDGRRVPTVFLIKPDQRRFWTRSMGIRDADAVSADIMTWRSTGEASTKQCPS